MRPRTRAATPVGRAERHGPAGSVAGIQAKLDEQLRETRQLLGSIQSAFPWYVSESDPLLEEPTPNLTLDRLLSELKLDVEESSRSMKILMTKLAPKLKSEAARSAALAASGEAGEEIDGDGGERASAEATAARVARQKVDGEGVTEKTEEEILEDHMRQFGSHLSDDLRMLDRAVREDPFRLRMTVTLYYLRDHLVSKLNEFLVRHIGLLDRRMRWETKWGLPKQSYLPKVSVRREGLRRRFMSRSMRSIMNVADMCLRMEQLFTTRIMGRHNHADTSTIARLRAHVLLLEEEAQKARREHHRQIEAKTKRVVQLEDENAILRNPRDWNKLNSEQVAVISLQVAKLKTVLDQRDVRIETLERELAQSQRDKEMHEAKIARMETRTGEIKVTHQRQVAHFESHIRRIERQMLTLRTTVRALQEFEHELGTGVADANMTSFGSADNVASARQRASRFKARIQQSMEQRAIAEANERAAFSGEREDLRRQREVDEAKIAMLREELASRKLVNDKRLSEIRTLRAELAKARELAGLGGQPLAPPAAQRQQKQLLNDYQRLQRDYKALKAASGVQAPATPRDVAAAPRAAIGAGLLQAPGRPRSAKKPLDDKTVLRHAQAVMRRRTIRDVLPGRTTWAQNDAFRPDDGEEHEPAHVEDTMLVRPATATVATRPAAAAAALAAGRSGVPRRRGGRPVVRQQRGAVPAAEDHADGGDAAAPQPPSQQETKAPVDDHVPVGGHAAADDHVPLHGATPTRADDETVEPPVDAPPPPFASLDDLEEEAAQIADMLGLAGAQTDDGSDGVVPMATVMSRPGSASSSRGSSPRPHRPLSARPPVVVPSTPPPESGSSSDDDDDGIDRLGQ